MGTLDHAAPLKTRRIPAAALTAAVAALCACSGIPPLIDRHDPLTAQEHASLGASYEKQGLKKEALDQYETAARLTPKDPEAWIALGNILFNGGELAAAESNYRRALKIAPHNAGASNNLAMVLLEQDKDIRQAETLAQDALKQEGPLKPYILDTLANVYLRQGRADEAQAAFERAEAATPADDPGFHDRLELTRVKIKEHRK
jgi:Tfp pilus assembly protein PilF